MKIRTTLITIIVVLMTIGYTSLTFGAISADEANKLGGSELTPLGAIKAGNADGSIPAWTGVQIPVPKGYKKGSGLYVDPFADEKPLFSINAKNMAQYADKLAEGVKALMRKYPDYRIDIYPTHRTAVFPQSYDDLTKKSAMACQISKNGRAITGKGCYGGVPFPIPKSGDELLWNHQMCFTAPEASSIHYENFNLTSTGKLSLASQSLHYYDLIWNDPGNDNDWKAVYYRYDWVGPPRRNGEIILLTYPKDWAAKGSVIWQYLPGQRRVRLAPDICCDTPSSSTGGASTYDDTAVFNGDPERYDWKLIGKKEMYIPYNAYKMIFYRGPVEKALLSHYINPDMVRWELHRLWVVEAKLKPGKRHVYSKRVIYFDEDSYTLVMGDNYDKLGNLYRMTVAYPTWSYDVQAIYRNATSFHDMISNSYAINVWPRLSSGLQYMKFHPASFYSPDSIAGGGLR